MQRTAALSTAALLALGTIACGDPSSGGADRAGEPRSLNALEAAAQAVDDAGTSRMDMRMKTEIGNHVFTLKTDGVFDYENETGEGSMTMAAPDIMADLPGLSGRTKMVFHGGFLYLKGPIATAYGASATGWGRLDTGEMGAEATQINQDPSQYLDFLRSAGAEVDEAGTENVGGVRTTHYTGEIAFEDLAARTDDFKELEAIGGKVAPIGLEAWIDDEGLPRRMSFAMEIDGVSGIPEGRMTVRATIDLFDYGVGVDVSPPKNFEDIAPLPAG